MNCQRKREGAASEEKSERVCFREQAEVEGGPVTGAGTLRCNGKEKRGGGWPARQVGRLGGGKVGSSVKSR